MSCAGFGVLTSLSPSCVMMNSYGILVEPVRKPSSHAPITTGSTCAFHSKWLFFDSFSVTTWPSNVLVIVDELAMIADWVLLRKMSSDTI
jgi:hypothetical protein